MTTRISCRYGGILATFALATLFWAPGASAYNCNQQGDCVDHGHAQCDGLVYTLVWLDYDDDAGYSDIACCCQGAPTYENGHPNEGQVIDNQLAIGDDCDDDADDVYVGAAPFDSVVDCTKDTDDDDYGDATGGEPFTPGSDCDDDADDTYPGAAPFDSLTDCMKDTDDDDWGDDATGEAYDAGSDCNDDDADVNPDEIEVCNGIDDDCAGGADDGLTFTDWYEDVDIDGYGDEYGTPINDCEAPVGDYVADHSDCDDSDPDINPGETEVCNGIDDDCVGGADDGLTFLDYYPDDDEDTYGDENASPENECEAPADHVTDNTDCDDSDSDVNPGETETCNGIDDDCVGGVDDGLTFVDYYPDDDLDGYGDMYATPDNACEQPAGWITDHTDCDDTEGTVYPGATELCDYLDNDCDGALDTDEVDNDGDSYDECEGDCNDGNAAINPGASEVSCDYVDNNCDLVMHPDEVDNDGDSYDECSDDCDDTDAFVSPGATEIACDYIDNDCDGDLHGDEEDDDGDGWDECNGDCSDGQAGVNPGVAEVACDYIDNNCDTIYHPQETDDDGDGWDECSGDADDTDPTINPGASEIACDYIDNDGDGYLHPDEVDNDSDTYDECEGDCNDASAAVHPNAQELACDYLDNNCDTVLHPEEVDDDGDGYDECSGDVDDTDPLINPGVSEIACDYIDNDGDGNLHPEEVDNDADGSDECEGDCDDSNAAVHPAAQELACDYIDNNCDATYHPEEVDDDGDGYDECSGDADDTDPLINPGAGEVACDYIDNDGDGNLHPDEVDNDNDGFDECQDDCDDTDDFTFPGAAESDSVVECMTDADQDGFGDSSPGGGVTPGNDCNDGNPLIKPGASEVACDYIDNNCDGNQHAQETDDDADGYDECADDCDDSNALINPGQTEVACDYIDNNCDGSLHPQEVDDDGDGWDECEGDSDDTDPTISPGVSELPCDYIDNNADGILHPNEVDDDGDGWDECSGDCDDTLDYVNPDETELACDYLDNDCDGFLDGDEIDDDSDGQDECNGDCDDGDTTIYDGAVEIACDYKDNDCDGDLHDEEVDDDGDGYDECQGDGDDTNPNINPGVDEIACDYVDNNGDGDLHEDEVDDDEDGYDECSDDCNDADEDIGPHMLEICETTGDQVDTDCDGNVNTNVTEFCQTGSTWCSQLPNEGWLTYYRDADGDGFGSEDTIYFLCEAQEGFTAVPGDCSDVDPTTYPFAAELCDERDNNCNGQVDETTEDEDPVNCVDLYQDGDADGFGDPDNRLCLCVTGDTISDDCPSDIATITVDYDNACYLSDKTDCNDSDPNMHPRYNATFTAQIPYEQLDGADNDCDGDIPLVELDCDDDGYLSAVPSGVAFNDVILDVDASENPISPLTDDGELLGCEVPPGGSATFQCWDSDVDIRCAEEGGLWTLALAVAEDKFENARRVPATTGIGDCDDQCAERHPDYFEVCDGLDNDCDGTSFSDEDDEFSEPGIPDAMEAEIPHYGWVSASEMDLDGDGFVGCFDSPSGAQDYETARSCADPIPDGGDCNNLCGLAKPDAEESCNGFLDLCEDVDEGMDADRDDHHACGAFSGDDSLPEHIYVLAYLDPLEEGEADQEDLVPFILPRVGADECDTPLSKQLGMLLGEETLAQAIEDETLEPALQYCIRAHLCDSDSGDPNCDQVHGACVVLRLELGEGLDAKLDDLGGAQACQDQPEQLITRTVWHRERIIQARQLVAWWECYRLYGTYGCADIKPPSDALAFQDLIQDIEPGGRDWGEDETFGDLVATGKQRWMELSRYSPDVVDTVMAGCWEDDVATALARKRPPSDPIALNNVGGDCADGDTSTNRDQSEGPEDLLGSFFGHEQDCRTCLDGIDNNCNGLADCEDPACAECFVGQGLGCGVNDSPCSDSGCSTTGERTRAAGNTTLMALLFAAALACRWRRVR